MTDFTGAVLHWCQHAEAHGLYGVEYHEDYIGAWDANDKTSLAIVCAEDFEQHSEIYFEASTLLADRLSRVEIWDEERQEYVIYPHLPVLVVPAGVDTDEWMPYIERWDGRLWEWDGVGMVGIDR